MFDKKNNLPPTSNIFLRLPRSSPSSPAPSKKGKRPASASPIRRRLLSSPLLSRKARKSRGESSDEEGLLQDDSSTNYRDLETFQKAQLRQKVNKKRLDINTYILQFNHKFYKNISSRGFEIYYTVIQFCCIIF